MAFAIKALVYEAGCFVAVYGYSYYYLLVITMVFLVFAVKC